MSQSSVAKLGFDVTITYQAMEASGPNRLRPHASSKVERLRASYLALLKKTQRIHFPGFVANLENQAECATACNRVVALKFDDKGAATVTRFATSQDLSAYLNGEATSRSDLATLARRSFYLLEDLHKENIEILGSRLCIPPSVFAAHWADPTIGHGTFDSVSQLASGPNYFRIKYRQLHRICNKEYPLGLYRDRYSNVDRWLQLLDRSRHFESSEHYVSYWSAKFGDKSWIGEIPLPKLSKHSLIDRDF